MQSHPGASSTLPVHPCSFLLPLKMEQPASPKPLPKASPDLVKKASSCASAAGTYPPRCRRPGVIATRSRFPVCPPCYECEDSIQACLQFKTKYKRHKGSPPVRANPSRERERIAGKDEGAMAILVTNGTSIAPSEGHGVGDIDASTGYNMEDTLL